MSKKSTTATTTATMKTVNELYNVFVTELLKNNKVEKVNFSDAKTAPYCGLNNFSINVKKSFYNVYMNTENANKCTAIDKNLTVLENGCDTTKKQLRNKLIRFEMNQIETLEKCIKTVCA